MGASTPRHLSELARQLRPELQIVSISAPDPLLAGFNVVAEVESTEQARAVVVELENLLDTDDGIGLVVMGSSPDEREERQVDPEGATGAVAKRIVVGGLIGVAVGAVLGAILGFVLGGSAGAIGMALGGAALLGPIIAIWVVFTQLGGTDAYRQTFVEPQVVDVTFVTFHSDDEAAAEMVRRRLASETGIRLVDAVG